MTILGLAITNAQSGNRTKSDVLASEYLGQAETFGESGEFENAIKYCNLAFEVAENKLPVHRARSLYYFTSQNYTKAIEDYTKLIELAPEDLGKSYFFRGLSKMLMNQNMGEACADIQKAKSLGYTEGIDIYINVCEKI